MNNVMLGGAAGQGVETTAEIFEKILKKAGFYVHSVRNLMSRVRGGHNFTSIRFGNEPVYSHSGKFDVIVALNEESVQLHKNDLGENGFILCDSKTQTEIDAVKLPMSDMASELGNAKVSGVIAVGALLRYFDIDITFAEEVLRQVLKPALFDINMQAIQKGYSSVEPKFQAVSGDFSDWMILSGSEAVGLGAIAAGVNFYSAYPMSPSTAVMEYLASVGEKAGIVVEQAEDEIAGINMAIGASFAGGRAMTGTSGGGFCLKVEALGFSGIAEIPLVVIDVMRPGPATGLPTRTEQSDLKFVISASQGEFPRMVIALRSHEDAIYQTFRAFQLAEKYQIPVILLSDQYIGDSHATVKPLDFSGKKNILPDVTHDDTEYLRYKNTESGISKRLVPGKTKSFVLADSDEHDEKGHIIESAEDRILMADKRTRKVQGLLEELLEPEYFGKPDADILVVGWGSTYGPIIEAVNKMNEEGGSYGALIFGDIFPLPKKKLEEFTKKSSKIINVEQNATGQLAGVIREYTGIVMSDSILKYDGRQISGEEIVIELKKGVR